MRILLTNDDGIDAPGLECLEAIARELSDDVWIAAPAFEKSACSRALTISDPVRMAKVGPQRYAIQGTPTDCILMALGEFMADKKPDLVLSGVNRGQNLAEDTTQSGTVAGAFQGMVMGVRSIALSQAMGFEFSGSGPRWETARHYGPNLIRTLLGKGWPETSVININFPDCPPEKVAGVALTRQGFRDHQIVSSEKRTDRRGFDYWWIGYRGQLSDPPEGTDLHAVYRNFVSVTPLQLDLTCRSGMAHLEGLLD